MSDAQSLPLREKVLALAGVLLGMLLAALDQTIVATAGPTIQRELHIEPSLYTWITTSYLVASTVLVPIWGKLSDLIGRRRVLLLGIGIFLLGSVLCGISQSALQLILFRAVQGVGSASLFTSALATVADLFNPQERGKWQGLFGAVFGLSSVIGPLAGGFITDHIGWHWVFFINIPVGAVAVAFILAKMPPLLPAPTAKRPGVDVLGALALALGVIPLLLALSFGKGELRPGETGWLWTSPQILGLFAAALVGVVLFLLVESRAADPIVDLKLFKNRAFAIGNLCAFMGGLTFLGAIVFLPLFVTNVVGGSATSAGLTAMPLTMGIVVANISSGNLVSRVGRYKIFILGSQLVAALVFAWLALSLAPDSTKLSVSVKMFFLGLGIGPAIPLFTLAVQSAVPPQIIGASTAVSTFSRQLGATVGLAVLGTVFATTLSTALRDTVGAETRGAPPAGILPQEHDQSTAVTGEGPAPFDEAAVTDAIRARFADQRRRAEMGAGADADAVKGIAQLEAQALEAARAQILSAKAGFTRAFVRVFWFATAFAVLALLCSLLLPELPLRRAPGGPPAPTE